MEDFYTGRVVGIDRGRISEKNGALYRVASYTRDGVLSRWMEAVQGEYAPEDKVYFFMFDDGRGMIVGRMID